MHSDDRMIGPGAHEDAAREALNDRRPEDAQVLALLAIASAINRAADQLEQFVAARL